MPKFPGKGSTSARTVEDFLKSATSPSEIEAMNGFLFLCDFSLSLCLGSFAPGHMYFRALATLNFSFERSHKCESRAAILPIRWLSVALYKFVPIHILNIGVLRRSMP